MLYDLYRMEYAKYRTKERLSGDTVLEVGWDGGRRYTTSPCAVLTAGSVTIHEKYFTPGTAIFFIEKRIQ